LEQLPAVVQVAVTPVIVEAVVGRICVFPEVANGVEVIVRFHPFPLPVRSLAEKSILKSAVPPTVPPKEYVDGTRTFNEPAVAVPVMTGESARAGVLIAGNRSPTTISSMQSAPRQHWRRKCSIRFNMMSPI
jgi:hypothetical protein